LVSDRPILVTGADGMLGHALRRRWTEPDAPPHPVLWTDVAQLDITHAAAVSDYVAAHRPAAILNLAAMTDVDGCESRQDLAFRINAEAVRHLAAAANDAGCKLVQISTDFVFPGDAREPYREDAATGPLSVYGASKLAGEVAARQARDHLVLRTAWLYGPRGKNFVRAICARADSGQPLRVVGDQVGCPTCTTHLAEAIVRLLRADARGTVHAAGSEVVTWLEFARAIVALWRPGTAVAEITSAELGRPATRPAYSVLDGSRLHELTGYRVPGMSEALPAYLTELRRELQGERAS
jgi:dTDP-4-dehydrorhamnose reductase